MNRRQLLSGAAGVAASLAAGCSSGSTGRDGPSETTTSKTTTSTVQSSDLEYRDPKASQYSEWMVAKEGASLFLYDYLPEYSWYYNNAPASYIQNAIKDLTTGPSSGVLAYPDIEEYFYGFTDVASLKYHLLKGSFEPKSIRETLVSEENFEATEESVGEFELLQSNQTVVGLAPGRWVDVSVGFADPMKNFKRVVEQFGGKGTSYVEQNEAYRLLTQNLQQGQFIASRPEKAKQMGATAYGRQYVWGNETFARPEEVLVFDETPGEQQVRSAVQGTTAPTRAYDGTIDTVEIDGRVSKVVYKPMKHGTYMRVSGYTTK